MRIVKYLFGLPGKAGSKQPSQQKSHAVPAEQVPTLEELVMKAREKYEKEGRRTFGGVNIHVRGGLPPELKPYEFITLWTKWGRVKVIALTSGTEEGWIVRVQFVEDRSP